MTPVLERDVAGYGRVAVLMGGTSAEREISIETGTAVHAALCRRGVEATALDVAGDAPERLRTGGFDRAFIALHGRGGEDGVVQGMLEAMGIPYTGSGVLGSALSMDKTRTKWIWNSQGLATPECIELRDRDDLERACVRPGLPLMVKPVHEGSSCGAAKVKHGDELEAAWVAARRYDARVLAERWIEGVEYTAAILNDRVLPLIRLETPREFYDYQAKYMETTTRYLCPCGLDPNEELRLAAQALAAFRAVNASGWGRVDIIRDADGTAWLIEVNTVPGMTSHSLVPMAAAQAGIGFDDLVLQILDTSCAVTAVQT